MTNDSGITLRLLLNTVVQHIRHIKLTHELLGYFFDKVGCGVAGCSMRQSHHAPGRCELRQEHTGRQDGRVAVPMKHCKDGDDYGDD